MTFNFVHDLSLDICCIVVSGKTDAFYNGAPSRVYHEKDASDKKIFLSEAMGVTPIISPGWHQNRFCYRTYICLVLVTTK